jgi:hypothetical protein
MAIRGELLGLLTAAFEKAASQLGPDEPWPEDLRVRDVVRLLPERSREVAADQEDQ